MLNRDLLKQILLDCNVTPLGDEIGYILSELNVRDDKDPTLLIIIPESDVYNETIVYRNWPELLAESKSDSVEEELDNRRILFIYKLPELKLIFEKSADASL